MNVLDLFSGIGGFSLGLESLGTFKTTAFCEKDEFCRKVLRKHWHHADIYKDIRDVDGTKISADIITGGFPCQPISIAGKLKGKEDDRYLFPEMLRIIKEVQPRWIIGENVRNITNISNGEILQEIHNDLETCGYEVQSFIISAYSQGARHKRDRVWILASHTDSRVRRRWRTVKSSGENKVWGFCATKEKSKRSTQDVRSKVVRCDAPLGKNVSDTNSERSQGHGLQTNLEEKQGSLFTERSPKEQPSWWETQSDFLRSINGISYELDKTRKHRIMSLGNAIVPQIAREIGKAILKGEEII